MKTIYWPSDDAKHGSRNAEMPSDLSAWFSNSILIQEVYTAIYATPWPAPRKQISGECPEAILRTLVVYCFATGIYGSREMEAAASHDPVVRYLCARHFPRWEEIREFRRQNTPFLKTTVAALLAALYRKHVESEPECYAGLSASRFGYNKRDFFCLAEDILRRAIQEDSMAMDD